MCDLVLIKILKISFDQKKVSGPAIARTEYAISDTF